MSSESSGVKIMVPPQPNAQSHIKVNKRKFKSSIKDKDDLESVLNRTDIKKKDARADLLTNKYSESKLSTKSLKEFKPLQIGSSVRS